MATQYGRSSQLMRTVRPSCCRCRRSCTCQPGTVLSCTIQPGSSRCRRCICHRAHRAQLYLASCSQCISRARSSHIRRQFCTFWQPRLRVQTVWRHMSCSLKKGDQVAVVNASLRARLHVRWLLSPPSAHTCMASSSACHLGAPGHPPIDLVRRRPSRNLQARLNLA